MHDALKHAREFATHWREANEKPGGVVLLLDGHFVGWLAQLPPATEWAPGCLAVSESAIHLARPAGFRGEVEWLDLGLPEEPEEPESSEQSPALPS